MKTIDLDEFTDGGRVHNLAGKERGEFARQKLNIDSLDTEESVIEVLVPEHIYAVSSSFFLGLFSLSLQALGTKESFSSKYQFRATPTVQDQIDRAIEICALTR